MSKQVSLPKISSILQKMKIGQNLIYALFVRNPSIITSNMLMQMLQFFGWDIVQCLSLVAGSCLQSGDLFLYTLFARSPSILIKNNNHKIFNPGKILMLQDLSKSSSMLNNSIRTLYQNHSSCVTWGPAPQGLAGETSSLSLHTRSVFFDHYQVGGAPHNTERCDNLLMSVLKGAMNHGTCWLLWPLLCYCR